MLVRHMRSVTRKIPGIRIIHQLSVSNAFSANDSILPQEMISKGVFQTFAFPPMGEITLGALGSKSQVAA